MSDNAGPVADPMEQAMSEIIRDAEKDRQSAERAEATVAIVAAEKKAALEELDNLIDVWFRHETICERGEVIPDIRAVVKENGELREQLAAMKAERDSESAWAEEYHSEWLHERDRAEAVTAELDALAGQNAELRELLEEEAESVQWVHINEERFWECLSCFENSKDIPTIPHTNDCIRARIERALSRPLPEAAERVQLNEKLRECWEDYFQGENQMDTFGFQEIAIDEAKRLLAALDGGKEQDATD